MNFVFDFFFEKKRELTARRYKIFLTTRGENFFVASGHHFTKKKEKIFWL
jgi:hypothetical protein